jgi:fermentation-respiration switch protein FrsA (DUF1100 family)
VSFFLSRHAQSLFYYPDQQDYGTSPQRSGLPYEDVTFKSHDGTPLNAWFVPAVGEAKGTVLHVHGNAGNITAHWPFVEWLPQRGFNVLTFDYRGFGLSPGKPTPEGLFDDTHGALDYMRSHPEVDAERLLVFAQSLGGNNAIAAIGSGNRAGVRAIVVEATFYSYSAIANDVLPGSGLLLRNDYSAERFIAALSPIPLLLLHGTADAVIPFRHSQRLFEKARPPKELLLIPRGGHIAATVDGGDTYRDIIAAFFEAALATAPMR